MQISSLDYPSYLRAIGIGRMQRRIVKCKTQRLLLLIAKGKRRPWRVLQLLGFMATESGY